MPFPPGHPLRGDTAAAAARLNSAPAGSILPESSRPVGHSHGPAQLEKLRSVKRTILIVDDDPAIRRVVKRHTERQGWQTLETACFKDAQKVLASGVSIHTVLCDVILPDGRGWELLDELEAGIDKPAMIVMTGDERVDHAVSALRRDATDFLLKPFSLSQLDDALARSCTEPPARRSLAREVTTNDRWRADNAPQILGTHPSIESMLEVARRVAESDSSVLVSGESGTGKELVARAIHMASKRRLCPLVTLNCAAIPESLIESELFGHVRGAFTGATMARQGHFVAADTGTILLDEIGELPMNMQSKLLRVLQEREVVPVGQQQSIQIDTRIIAATNVDLEQAIADGRFREDLYYRLNVIPIEIPPLRTRRSDIPDLITFFIDRYNKRRSSSVRGVDTGTLDRLRNYDWPGNVRELENTIERMVVLKGEGTLTPPDLPERLRGPSEPPAPDASVELPAEGIDFRNAVEAFECSLIRQALAQAAGNKSQAARLLNMRRTTFIEKLKRLSFPGLDEDPPSGK